MKQIKVIADEYNQSSGGLLNANFNETVEIKPYSKIVLDKFMVVLGENSTGYIAIPDQILSYSPQATTDRKAQASRNVVIPAGRYNYNNSATSGTLFNDLLSTITELLNGSLNSSPQISTASGSPSADLGLGFKLSSDAKGMTLIECYQCNLNQAGRATAPSIAPQIVNIGAVSTQGYSPLAVGEFSLFVPTPVISGALQVKIQLRIGDDDFGTYIFGIADTPALMTSVPDVSYGIKVDGTTNLIYFHSPNGDVLCPFTKGDILAANPNSSLGAQFYFYTANNRLQILIYNSDGTTVFFDSGASTNAVYNNVYQGFRYADVCHLAIVGLAETTAGILPIFRNIALTEQPNLALDNVGFYQYVAPSRSYFTTNGLGAIPARAIRIDFSGCPVLQSGLGFHNNVLDGDTSSGTGYLLFTSDSALNFAQFLDLAIETLNIPLQTYVSKTDGKDCGKRNVLCYFTPSLVSQTDNVYLFENKNLTFLSINNQQSMNLSSMQFRIYNPQSNLLTLSADYLSFNLYIADQDEH
jgi:hypothetical protein